MSRHTDFLLCIAVIGSLSGAACAAGNGQSDRQMSAQSITPSELVNRNPESGDSVSVKGVLENAGKNYFTDRRVVLRDPSSGPTTVVVTGMPLTETPTPNSSELRRPTTLSDYLGKEVVISGNYADAFVKGIGKTKVLKAEKIEPLAR